MKRHYRQYTDKDVISAVKEVKSMSALLRKLGLKEAGGNYANMRRTLQTLKLNCNHWTGMGWSKDKQLKNWKEYSKIESLKPHLIKLRGKACEVCALAFWQNKPISLELHHLDGDRTNNELANLQLLCPNCHSYTDFYRNRKRE